MKHARINADLFRAVALAQSTEQHRFYLCGVFVEPHPVKGILLTATDGHRLVNAWDEFGEVSESGIVSLPADILKACVDKHASRTVCITDSIPSVRLADDSLVAQGVAPCLVDGTFPDWRYVIPRPSANSPAGVAFRADLVASFAPIAAALAAFADNRSKTAKAISFAGVDAVSAHLVRFAVTDKAFGVIMPHDHSAPDFLALPDYMGAKPEEEAIAA